MKWKQVSHAPKSKKAAGGPVVTRVTSLRSTASRIVISKMAAIKAQPISAGGSQSASCFSLKSSVQLCGMPSRSRTNVSSLTGSLPIMPRRGMPSRSRLCRIQLLSVL